MTRRIREVGPRCASQVRHSDRAGDPMYGGHGRCLAFVGGDRGGIRAVGCLGVARTRSGARGGAGSASRRSGLPTPIPTRAKAASSPSSAPPEHRARARAHRPGVARRRGRTPELRPPADARGDHRAHGRRARVVVLLQNHDAPPAAHTTRHCSGDQRLGGQKPSPHRRDFGAFMD